MISDSAGEFPLTLAFLVFRKLWPFLKANRLNPLHGTSLHISSQADGPKELHIIRATHPGWQVLTRLAGCCCCCCCCSCSCS